MLGTIVPSMAPAFTHDVALRGPLVVQPVMAMCDLPGTLMSEDLLNSGKFLRLQHE